MSASPPPPPPPGDLDDLFAAPAISATPAASVSEAKPAFIQIPWAQRFPVHAAAQCGDSAALSALLLSTDKVEDSHSHTAGAATSLAVASARDDDSWLPLHYAAWEGHTACVLLLLQDAPSLLAAGNHVGATALHLAAGMGREATVAALLAAATSAVDVAARDAERQTPAMVAAALCEDAEARARIVSAINAAEQRLVGNSA